jgi:hypothetical protein
MQSVKQNIVKAHKKSNYCIFKGCLKKSFSKTSEVSHMTQSRQIYVIFLEKNPLESELLIFRKWERVT